MGRDMYMESRDYHPAPLPRIVWVLMVFVETNMSNEAHLMGVYSSEARAEAGRLEAQGYRTAGNLTTFEIERMVLDASPSSPSAPICALEQVQAGTRKWNGNYLPLLSTPAGAWLWYSVTPYANEDEARAVAEQQLQEWRKV